MRITWTNNRFEAELTPGELWRDDKDAIQNAGFRTDGPPDWTWFTQKASTLNKLRDNKPKSGLSITELALEKYQSLNKQDEEKAALKKQFEQAKKQAAKSVEDTNEYYVDDSTGITCIKVKPGNKLQYTKYVPPAVPEERCMICDDPIYFFESENICLSCEKDLDIQPKV